MKKNASLTKPSLKSLTKQLNKANRRIHPYLFIGYFALVGGLCVYLILLVNQAHQSESTVDTTIQQEVGSIKSLNFDRDQAAIDAIRALEDQNINVESQFLDDRRNPFSE